MCGVNIASRLSLAADASAKEVDQDVVVLGSASCVRINAVEDADDLTDFGLKAGLFAEFAFDGGRERLPDLDGSARNRPLAFERLFAATDQQYAAIVDHEGADADERTFRIAAVHRSG
jgi:hypothetical protein